MQELRENDGTMISRVTRLAGAVAMVSSVIWFGTSFSAQMVAYDLFITGTPDLRPLDATIQVHTIRIVSNLLVVHAGAFVVLVPSLLWFFLRRTSVFASRAYYIMALVLCVFAVPGSAYTALQSWNLYQLFGDHTQAGAEHLERILPAFMRYYTTNGWMNFVSMAMYCTIIVVFVLQPLVKRERN